jgi:hypothetical protein
LLSLAGCTSPSEPDPFGEVPVGKYQSAFVAVVGSGEGGTSVTPISNPEGVFSGTMRFRVRARPNTTYLVQRAAEIGRPGGNDKVCQRAQGLPPWTASDPPFGPAFVTFPTPNPGPAITLTTDGRGEGSLDYEYYSPGLARGLEFDLMMRLVDDDAAPTSDLRSGCMTIVVE